ncbi:MAG: hypothetical protein ABW215_08480 [Kibdelosporangium sp.]
MATTPTTLTRLSAWCGLLAGLGIALTGGIEGFLGETAPTSFVLGLTPALAIPLLVALYQGHAAAAGRFGEVAYLVNLLGLGLFGGAAFTLNMALYHSTEPLAGSTRIALLGSAVVLAAGSVLFGVSMLRTKVYPAVAVWGYTVVLAIFALAAPLPDSPLTSGLHVLAGASIAWLALALPVRQPVPARGSLP